jgi:membrane protease YdiL (CAAX protease family)
MIFVEVLDAIIVVVALFKVPWPPPVGPSDPLHRRIGWLTGPLVLAVVLGLNFAYHAALESYLQFPEWARSKIGLPIGWAIVTVCIQPAIVEELFFRFIALGTLTRVMGIGGAICVSSVMFGMAHSGVLLSIPILTVVGAGLGFVRVTSGSIVLPMLLHALHNAVVLYLENAR